MTPAESLARRLVDAFGREAPRVWDVIAKQCTPTELAYYLHSWDQWARETQRIPDGEWRSHGFIGARRSGKTLAIAEWMQGEVYRRPGCRVLLVAQSEQKSIDIQVLGATGLVATSPPWNRAHWEPSTLTVRWANGSIARVISSETPHALRGDTWNIAWATELQSWSRTTRDESWANLEFATSAPPAKIVFDGTPQETNLSRALRARAEREPGRHRVVRLIMRDNAGNLAKRVIRDFEQQYPPGTRKHTEEVLGLVVEDVDGALFRQASIDEHRCYLPERDDIERRIISIDPAIGARETSDASGIVELALTRSDQILVIDDLSGKHEAHVWGAMVLDRYVASRCDLIVCEVNRGGTLVTQNLKAAAKDRGMRVEVVDARWVPRHTPGTVYVREVHAKGSKAERASPVATLYERGKVSHVRGAPLVKLEELMTTWVPAPEGVYARARRSPDAMDALVHGVVELANLGKSEVEYEDYTTVRVAPGPQRSTGDYGRARALVDDPDDEDDDDSGYVSKW
jgi:phage terminase large subunit-like protein